MTTEFDKENDSVWTYLNEVETLTSGSIKDVEMLKEKYDEELEDMTTGWDFIAPSGGAEEGQLDTLGFGKYKFYTSTSG